MPCSFPRDNACSTYENRPPSCRIHFNLNRDPLLCELLPGVTVPVPLLNMTLLQMVYMKIIGNDVLADIRDFFPDRRLNWRSIAALRSKDSQNRRRFQNKSILMLRRQRPANMLTPKNQNTR